MVVTPRAVVIHLTYINPQEEDQVWIRHFCIRDRRFLQGKFSEAAAKAIAFCDGYPLNNTSQGIKRIL